MNLGIDSLVKHKLAGLGEVFLGVCIPSSGGCFQVENMDVARQFFLKYKVEASIQIHVVDDGGDKLDFDSYQIKFVSGKLQSDIGGAEKLGKDSLTILNKFVEVCLGMLDTLLGNFPLESIGEQLDSIQLTGGFFALAKVFNEKRLDGFVDTSSKGHVNTFLEDLLVEDVITIPLIRARPPVGKLGETNDFLSCTYTHMPPILPEGGFRVHLL